MRIRNMIPNLLTLGNLACGLVAIVLLMDAPLLPGVVKTIGWLMVGALACDFCDGFIARALKATSLIGKELDSLADVVSFGVLPGLMVYVVLSKEMVGASIMEPAHHMVPGWHTLVPAPWRFGLPFVGLVIPILSALRLAKFNVDTRQSYGFLGLPTPANALFFLSIFLVFGLDGSGMGTAAYEMEYLPMSFAPATPSAVGQWTYPLLRWLHHPWVLTGLTLLFSILLVIEIPLLAMKFQDFSFRNNWPRYLLVLLSVTLLAIFWFRAIPLVLLLYFLVSFIDHRIHKG